jgi:hypothetical protein
MVYVGPTIRSLESPTYRVVQICGCHLLRCEFVWGFSTYNNVYDRNNCHCDEHWEIEMEAGAYLLHHVARS